MLTSRSLFMKGHVPPPNTQTVERPPTTQTYTPPRQDRNIVFDGVIDADGELVAMLEDTVAGKIIQGRVGESVAGGKITRITLDTITYESGGRSTRVNLGQTLDAGEAPMLISRATVMDSGIAGGSSPTTAPADPNDLIEQMKARRRKELGQ